MQKRLIYRLIWVPSAIALIVTVVVFARQPFALAVPLGLTPYTTQDKSLSIEHPLNWKPHTVESHAVMTQVTFAPGGNVRFVVTSDLQGALMADLLKSTGSTNFPSDMAGQLPGMEGQTPSSETPPTAPQPSPLAKLHAQDAKDLAKEYDDYKEDAGETTQISGMEAMVTDFTFTKRDYIITRAMIGRRATLLTGDRRITVLATCPKDARKIIFPTFTKMIDSLRIGQAGG